MSPIRPRRPVIVVGALGLLCLGAAIVIAGAERPSAGDGATPAGSESRDSASAGPASPGDGDTVEAPAGAARDAELPESVDEPTTDQWAPIVSVLVDRWLACAAAPDAACAEMVAQAGSAAGDELLGPSAAREDAEKALRSWAAGSRVSVVVDRLGDAVVVDLIDGETATASLLMMRSEAGWRVRAVLSGDVG